jgi:drug/metabolite transporter (DMT)-like permease
MAKHTKAYLSLIFICIVWGTTFLAIRIGVMHYPPFLFAGVRQAMGGIILMTAAAIINRQKDLSMKNILHQMLVGFLMLTLGNGLVSLGEKYINSGISALICSLMPLFAVMFNLMSSKKDHFNAAIGFGMVLGICGVALIFLHDIAEITKPAYLGGILATIIATCSWALGSVVNKKNVAPVNAFLDSGMQLLFGGIWMLLISPFADDYHGFRLWNTDGILALVYLIIFGSTLAYAAYMYTLSKLPVGIATIYAYINPLIAVIVGYIFMKEELNIYIGMAFITIVISVYLVNRGYRKQHKADLNISASIMAEAFPESVPAES